MTKNIVAFRSRDEIVEATQKQIDQEHAALLLTYVDDLRKRIETGEVVGLQTIEFGKDPDDWLSQIYVHPSLPTTAVIGALNLAVVESTDVVLYGDLSEDDEGEGSRD